jgi:hypothetical protein
MNIKTYKKAIYFLALVFILSSCGSKTIDQQVEEILTSEEVEERKEISYAIADSLNNRAAELLFPLYSNPVAIEAIENMLKRYSEILSNDAGKSEKVVSCINYITEPYTDSIADHNDLRVKFLTYALQIPDLNKSYEEALINSAKKHGGDAMLKIMDAWYENQNSTSLLNAVKGFENKAVTYLLDRIDTDTLAVDLLARFGKPIVNTMISKMKDDNQAVRFAAGDVLVRMLKYDPAAVDMLTSVIDAGGIKSIAKNYPFYIRLGQEGTEQLLLKALSAYFKTEMCLDYLNCGNSAVESGAIRIAEGHGYSVTQEFGNFNGPQWGSGN